MEEDNHGKNTSDSIELIYMDVKISNFCENLNKMSIVAEKTSKQKVAEIRSEPREDASLWMVRVLIIFFKLIGLATFTYRTDTQKKRKLFIFQHSKFDIVYNAVLISLMLASLSISIPYRFTMEYENKTNLNEVIETIQTVLGAFVICMILLFYCIEQKSLVRMMNRLTDIEHELDRLHDPSQRQRVLWGLIVVYILNGCLVITLATTEVLAFHTSPVSWLSDILPSFHVGWMLVQYFLLATIIQADFADVNRTLQNLSRVSTSDLQSQTFCQTRRVIVTNSTVHQLLKLRDVHCHLCEISGNVSDFYSLPVLYGVTFLFLTLVYNGYYLLSPLLMSDEVLEYKVFINTVFWIIYVIYPIFLLTSRITKLMNEMEKTGNVVHNILSIAIGKEAKSEICCSSRSFHFKYYIVRYDSQLMDTSHSITVSFIRWSVRWRRIW
ncbi:uncharacterized protein LOC114929276 isoform X2 [Nylanderia fulva]|uniref:uncharacterized protein LOC114929276 isoform X2 n=1 Tax=Nylanderia fulva TaxID=613905 RepID=UPI0010FB1936|nr:uncharacterized protein LOC114929276 isoform X2 [Nylanderia fulva]